MCVRVFITFDSNLRCEKSYGKLADSACVFNKMNDATIHAQTPMLRKDTVLNSMPKSVILSAIDLTDGFYQILIRPSHIPLIAVSAQWYAMGVAGDATRIEECTGYFQTHGVSGDETTS